MAVKTGSLHRRLRWTPDCLRCLNAATEAPPTARFHLIFFPAGPVRNIKFMTIRQTDENINVRKQQRKWSPGIQQRTFADGRQRSIWCFHRARCQQVINALLQLYSNRLTNIIIAIKFQSKRMCNCRSWRTNRPSWLLPSKSIKFICSYSSYPFLFALFPFSHNPPSSSLVIITL